MFNKTFIVFSVSLTLAGSAHAMSLSQYANLIANKAASTVWNDLTGPGVGQCRVATGVAGHTACQYYFVTGDYGDNLGYRGYPIYNTDNSSAASYRGTNLSHLTTSIGITQHSTGCFPGVGGLWGAPSGYKWDGNDTSEASMSAQAYAAHILNEALNDPINPCKIGVGGNVSSNKGLQTENVITNNYVLFAPKADGTANPDVCYNKLRDSATVHANLASPVCTLNGCTGTGHVSAEPYSPMNNTKICRQIFRRSSVSNATVGIFTPAQLAISQLIATANYVTGLSALYTSALVAEANAKPNSLYVVQQAKIDTSTISGTVFSTPATKMDFGTVSADIPATSSLAGTIVANASAAATTSAAKYTDVSSAIAAVQSNVSGLSAFAQDAAKQTVLISMAKGTTAASAKTGAIAAANAINLQTGVTAASVTTMANAIAAAPVADSVNTAVSTASLSGANATSVSTATSNFATSVGVSVTAYSQPVN